MDVVKVDHIFSFAFIEMKVFYIEKDGFAIADPFLFQSLMMIGNGVLRPSACLFRHPEHMIMQQFPVYLRHLVLSDDDRMLPIPSGRLTTRIVFLVHC